MNQYGFGKKSGKPIGSKTKKPIGSDTRTLTYDAASQITATTDTNPLHNRSYGYDALGRLIHQTNKRIKGVRLEWH